MKRYICQQDFENCQVGNKVSEEDKSEVTLESLTDKYNDLVDKFNSIVQKLKPATTMLIISLMALGLNAATPGTAKLGSLPAKAYVVTQEVDNVFQTWSRTNNYVKAETDPVFDNWLRNSYDGGASVFMTWLSGDFNTWTNNLQTTLNGKLTSSEFNTWKADTLQPALDSKLNSSWIDGTTITFPNTSTAGFYIGDQKLSDFIKVEEDPQFNKWAISANIGVGLGSTPTYNSIAIGSYMTTTNYYPDIPNYNFSPSYTTGTGWLRGNYSWDYSGPSVANDRSVAIGTSAQARDTVSIAIGVGALANGLHGPSDQSNWVEFHVPRIGVVIQDGQYVTNVLPNATVMLDPYMYERFPDIDTTKWNLVQTIGETNIYERPYSGLIDPRYCSTEEFAMYDKWMSSGQGPIKYKDATYGVAIGYRSLVSGYHTLALGHYARAYRPHCVAIGPSSHIKSEGAIGLGYYNVVETNSPFSLAIGCNVNIQPGITNAIVIGVPQPNFSRRFTEEYRNKGNSRNDLTSVYVYSQKPRAMKSNSINFVFNGNGLNDVFIDDVPMPDRMATDVRMVGCLNSNGKYDRASQIENEIRDMVGIPANDSSMVMFSRDGGLRIYTKKYLDAVDGDDAETIDANEKKGCIDDVWINGKNLGDIIRNISGSSISQQFLDYKASVSNAAVTAKASISSATNMQDIKNALNTFFDSIK